MGWELYNSINIPKAIELYTLSRWIVWIISQQSCYLKKKNCVRNAVSQQDKKTEGIMRANTSTDFWKVIKRENVAYLAVWRKHVVKN